MFCKTLTTFVNPAFDCCLLMCLTPSSLPRESPSKHLSATSNRASRGHSENQSIVVQFTSAGYWRIRFLNKYNTKTNRPYIPIITLLCRQFKIVCIDLSQTLISPTSSIMLIKVRPVPDQSVCVLRWFVLSYLMSQGPTGHITHNRLLHVTADANEWLTRTFPMHVSIVLQVWQA